MFRVKRGGGTEGKRELSLWSPKPNISWLILDSQCQSCQLFTPIFHRGLSCGILIPSCPSSRLPFHRGLACFYPNPSTVWGQVPHPSGEDGESGRLYAKSPAPSAYASCSTLTLRYNLSPTTNIHGKPG